MKRVLIAVCMGVGLMAQAQQDIHFSQFYSSPLNINPGMTGVIRGGDFRAIAQYRNQWSSITVPYVTMAASADVKVFKDQLQNGFMGIGVNFYKDDAGDSKFTSLKYNVSLSYSLMLDGDENNTLSLGFQGGFIQRTINFGGLYWDNQYVGTGFNTNLPSGEDESSNSVNALDLGTGLYWNYVQSETFSAYAGFSMFHLNSPNVSFTSREDNLLQKYVFHGGIEYAPDKNANYSFLPNLIYVFQGPNRIFNIGSDVKYMLQGKSRYTSFRDEVSISVGGYYRFKDAFFAALRFNYANFSIGATYDFTLSNLTTANNSLGGMEFLLKYRASFGGGGSAARIH